MQKEIKKNNYGMLVANNINEVEFAYKKGVNKKIPIYSFSPQLILNKKYPYSFSLENRLGLKAARKIRLKLFEFEKKIFPIIKNNKILSKYKLAIYGAIADFQNCFIKAYALKDNDFKKKIIILESLCSKNTFTKTTNFDWSEIIPKNKQIIIKLKTFKKKKKKIFFFKIFLKKINIFLKEFLLFPRDLFIKQLILKFRIILNPFFNKGKILICYDNSLITDSLYHLLLKGYLPEYINMKKTMGTKKLKKAEKKQIKEKILPSLKKFFKENLCKTNRIIVQKAFLRRIFYWMEYFNAGYEWWGKKLSNYNTKTKVAILSNTYNWPHSMCLQEICKKKKKKIFLCQHGISKEITNFISTKSFDESSKSNIVFTYSDECRRRNDKNIFSTAKSYTVGASKVYNKFPINILKKKIDFLYIGANRYVGDFAGNLECSDAQVAKYEIFIIKKILSKVSQKICYKPYPNLERYSDSSYVEKTVSKYKNISYLNTKENARDFYSRSKILIMSKASSTFTWSFMSNKPIVLINCPTQPFNNEIKTLLKKSVFFFDYLDTRFVNKIKILLSKKPEEIEKEYRKKLYYRKLLKNYLFSNSINAGKKIANIIHNNL